MPLAGKLKELRLKKGRSLQQVADAVRASKAHIWEVEKGSVKRPSLDLVMRLAEYFEVSIASLVGDDPYADDVEEELLVMFRDLKNLDPRDREMIQRMMSGLKQTPPKEKNED